MKKYKVTKRGNSFFLCLIDSEEVLSEIDGNDTLLNQEFTEKEISDLTLKF